MEIPINKTTSASHTRDPDGEVEKSRLTSVKDFVLMHVIQRKAELQQPRPQRYFAEVLVLPLSLFN